MHGRTRRLTSRQTWAELDSNAIALFKCLEKISTDPADNRSSYRTLLASIGKDARRADYSLDEFSLKSGCLPILTTFLLDIIYGEEGNAARLPSWVARELAAPKTDEDKTELVNFQRYR